MNYAEDRENGGITYSPRSGFRFEETTPADLGGYKCIFTSDETDLTMEYKVMVLVMRK